MSIIYDFKAIKKRCDEISQHTLTSPGKAHVKEEQDFLENLDDDYDDDDPPAKPLVSEKKKYIFGKKKYGPKRDSEP